MKFGIRLKKPLILFWLAVSVKSPFIWWMFSIFSKSKRWRGFLFTWQMALCYHYFLFRGSQWYALECLNIIRKQATIINNPTGNCFVQGTFSSGVYSDKFGVFRHWLRSYVWTWIHFCNSGCHYDIFINATHNLKPK